MPKSRRRFLRDVAAGSVAAAVFSGGRPAHPPWPPPDDLDDEAFWRAVRANFPLTYERTYMNAGGLGPAPYPVLDEEHRMTMEIQRISEHHHRPTFDEGRVPAAAFLGAMPSEIAFTRNATEGNAIVAMGVPMETGDEVIFESHAHPGGSFPWLNRQKLQGIVVRIFEPDPTSAAGNLERIENLITPRTRAIQVSHVTAPTGIRMPVREIAALASSRGLYFHVDGAQTAGMFPVDVSDIGCDSYATSGHKWMGAPMETGILVVREAAQDRVRPVEVGSYSDDGYDLPDRFEYNPTAERYEYGTRDAAKIVGIVAAIDFLNRIGMQRIGDYGAGLATYLQDRLRRIDGVTVLTPRNGELRGSMTTFRSDRVPHSDLVSYFIDSFHLRTRPVTEQDLNAVRVSTHVYNNREDCDLVVEALMAAHEELG